MNVEDSRLVDTLCWVGGITVLVVCSPLIVFLVVRKFIRIRWFK